MPYPLQEQGIVKVSLFVVVDGIEDADFPPMVLKASVRWTAEGEGADWRHVAGLQFEGIGEAHKNTTHFVVADRDGNVVSATVTLGNLFGSKIMPEGTGIWLNNSLQYCTFEPAGNPMDAHPGRRKLSSDSPSFVMRDGRPWLALGTPGGHTITQTTAQMIMNAVDFDMDIHAALNAPMIAFLESGLLLVDQRIPAARSTAATSSCPLATAMPSAVLPDAGPSKGDGSSTRMLGCSVRGNSSRTTSRRPFSAAAKSGSWPSCIAALGLAP